MHYYKRNIGDYAKKAGRLSMLQHGAYTMLLDACYDRETFPTREEAIEWTWASTPEEVAAVEFVLSRFFILEDVRHIQKRIQEEIDAFKEKSKKNQEIALAREEERRKRKERNEHELARNVHESPPNHKPLTTNQDKDIQTTSVSRQGADCPHQKLIDIYHEAMPTNPAVKVWSEKRQQMMRARWRERMADKKYQTEEEGLAYWKRYFEYCATSPFLTGKVQKGDKPAFTADMEWLINSSNFVKVIEGRYHGE